MKVARYRAQCLVILIFSDWPRGEIGRRAGFRFLYSQGCVGSTPTEATTPSKSLP
jgi:hypothetical protein